MFHQDSLALGERVLVEHVSDVQGALVGDLNADVILVRGERCLQPCLLSLGEAFASGPQEGPDAVERVALATPVPESLLLDTTADVINNAGGELDDMKRIQNAGGVFQLVVDRVLVSLERVQRRDLHTLTEDGPACGEPVLVHGARASRDEIQQPCGSVPVAGEVDHAGEFFRPCLRGFAWCHTCSSTPRTSTPSKRAGSAAASVRRGRIWDHRVFQVVPSWRASPWIEAFS